MRIYTIIILCTFFFLQNGYIKTYRLYLEYIPIADAFTKNKCPLGGALVECRSVMGIESSHIRSDYRTELSKVRDESGVCLLNPFVFNRHAAKQ